MEFIGVSKRATGCLLIAKLFVFLFLVTGYILGLVLVENDYDLIIIIGGTSILVISAIDTFVFSFMQQKRILYYFDEDKIIIKNGVVFRKYIAIPMLQIQDIGSFQGPIMMMFNIKKILISTAGSNRDIYGLDAKIADELVDILKVKVQEKLKKEANNEEI